MREEEEALALRDALENLRKIVKKEWTPEGKGQEYRERVHLLRAIGMACKDASAYELKLLLAEATGLRHGYFSLDKCLVRFDESQTSAQDIVRLIDKSITILDSRK